MSSSFVSTPDPSVPESRVSIVVAMAANRVIGADGGMPWHLPEDLMHFKRLTTGSAMIMGRRTFGSIGGALPGRRSIVMTRDEAWSAPGAEVARSLQDAVALAGTDRITICGGGAVYEAVLQPDSPVLVDTLHITYVHATPEGDTFFPAFSTSEWAEVGRREGEGCTFVDYVRA